MPGMSRTRKITLAVLGLVALALVVGALWKTPAASGAQAAGAAVDRSLQYVMERPHPSLCREDRRSRHGNDTHCRIFFHRAIPTGRSI